MKSFLLKTLIFFAIIATIDLVAGKTLSYMVAHSKGGENGRNNYICNEVDADVLIFGSSRAIHHYNPKIITDTLKMSCYNCGMDGNGIILNYGRYQMICQRYHPKIVIYDVMPSFDLLAGDDNHKYLGWLRAYYDRIGVSEIFDKVDSTEKYKMLSQCYRYNTKFIQIISDFIHPIQDDGCCGYRPNEGELDTMKIGKNLKFKDFEYDTLKVSYFKKLVTMSSDTKIIFVLSPHWYGMDTTPLKPIMDMCNEYGCKFYDFSNRSKYLGAKRYFKDGSHLNSRGADEFSKDIASQIKRDL